jgi:hypothetical protein
MLQLPTVEQSTSRVSVCPPAAPAKKKVTRTSANFETMFYWLYDDKMKESTKRLRRIRSARRIDSGCSQIFDDAVSAIKQCHYDEKKLEAKMAELPDNQKIELPLVRINYHEGYAGFSSSFPSDVDRYFTQWIKEAKNAGDYKKSSELLERRNRRLKQLKRDNRAVFEDQKQSGLWQLRVEAAAAANVANRLTYEASETKLRTVADCAAAARFLGVLCREDIRHRDGLNTFVVSRLSKRLVECLSSLEGRMR